MRLRPVDPAEHGRAVPLSSCVCAGDKPVRATRRPPPRTRRSAIAPAARGTSAPRGRRSRSELEWLVEYDGVTVRRAHTTTIDVRHRSAGFVAARRHRAPPLFQKVSRDREARGAGPVPTGVLRTTPHRRPGQSLTGPTAAAYSRIRKLTMHIGFAGPVDLATLRSHLPEGVPAVYAFPYTGWLVRTWLEQGHRVTVYALSAELSECRVYGDGDPLRIVAVPQRHRARHRARDFFLFERRGLARAMREHPADVISAHWTYEFALAATDTGLPSCVTAHDAPLRAAWEMRSAFRWMRHSLALPAVHRATTLSAVSPYTVRHLRRCLGVRRHVEVIPNGVLLDSLPRAGAPRHHGEPVFASALQGWGRLKNGIGLLQAFRQVRDRLPAARLLMCGAGFGPGGPAENWAVGKGLHRGVEFAGPTAHPLLLQRLAREADVLVHPSRAENLPLTILEAMAVGVPVVAGGRSGGVPWVLDDGRAGVLTDVEDPAVLASDMTELFRDHERRVLLAERARKRVEGSFRLQDVARAYVDWFRKAC
ncbi:glycosyltransferase family 1 protein [Streptomyces sp. ICN441]|nr:glycosyltransferase family 1 protein [Streptomyces sp. ICN441]